MSNNGPNTSPQSGAKEIADALLQAINIFRQEAGLAGATGIAFVIIFFGLEGIAKKFIEPNLIHALDLIAICTLVSGLFLMFVTAVLHVIRMIHKTIHVIRYGEDDEREP